MRDGVTITEAIATLRRLHEAGYALAPLVAVAQQHEPDLATRADSENATAAQYRDQLSAECGCPALSDFLAAWPADKVGRPGWINHAWSELGPKQRRAAIAGIAGYIETRQLAGLDRATTAAGYLHWLIR